MTIEMRVISKERHRAIHRQQLAVGDTIDLGRKGLKEELPNTDHSKDFSRKVEVISHDQIVDKVVDSFDNGTHHLKTKSYINENPPWGEDHNGNTYVIYWSPTVYGENGSGDALGFSSGWDRFRLRNDGK